MKKLVLLILAAAAAPALAAPSAKEARSGEQARIVFPDRGGIWNFHAESDDVLYLQDRSRRWYRAELASKCWGLTFANAIGYDTRGSSTFDRYSAVIVNGERCHLLSLTRSEKPDRRRGRKAKRAA
jgi:hypothetical protein